ncbi:MAG: hypothetical protein FWD77_09615 [Betaproteobacteria bacterium]|nr:hypothetical protein [Betaproteobacteria bacterium]
MWPLTRHPARSEAESQDPEEDANPCSRASSVRFAAAGRLPLTHPPRPWDDLIFLNPWLPDE